jgi:hypothetical protein
MFDNRVVRKLLESKRAEVAGGWTELHKDEHHFYCSSILIGDQVRVDERGGACGTYGGR